MPDRRWLNVAAFATWLVCGVQPIGEIVRGEWGGWPPAAWAVAFLTYGAALALTLTPRPAIRRRMPARAIPALVVQSLAGLAITSLTRNGTSGATLVIVAAELPYFISNWKAWTWVAVQTLALATSFAWLGSWIVGAAIGLSLGGFQLFALVSSFAAKSERAAREALAEANAQLVATQSLLAESSRVAERTRIARDLHDALGHHLTALSLQLDVASRLTSGQAAEHVQEAHAVTRLLLSDVREVVSEMRATSRIDLATAVRALGSARGPLKVHLDIPSSLPMDDPRQAHALLHALQEIITNASRHAGAHNLWIRLERKSNGVDLHARDDGHGAADLVIGNGLKGMRERFEECGGRVEFIPRTWDPLGGFDERDAHGFEVHGFMPSPEIPS